MQQTDSILLTVKKMVGGGFDPEQDDFDIDIITHINYVFSILNDLGIGPDEGFEITDSSTNWSDYEPGNKVILSKVKSYMYAKVRLLFDPPTNSSLLDNLTKLVSEFEWRLEVDASESKREEP